MNSIMFDISATLLSRVDLMLTWPLKEKHRWASKGPAYRHWAVNGHSIDVQRNVKNRGRWKIEVGWFHSLSSRVFDKNRASSCFKLSEFCSADRTSVTFLGKCLGTLDHFRIQGVQN
jgi:hypothetical protein